MDGDESASVRGLLNDQQERLADPPFNWDTIPAAANADDAALYGAK